MKLENQQKEALAKIEAMGQEEMCRIWRFHPVGTDPYFSDTIIGKTFYNRLWEHFGGFTPEISKRIGWE